MKVCEVCGGMGHRRQILCASCHGTGLICLGHESAARYERLKMEARGKAARSGWSEIVWEGEPGNGRKVARPVVSIAERQTA